MDGHLILPHGGRLIDLLVDPEKAAQLRGQSRDWPSLDLTQRQLCDLELLLTGGFSPLSSFMGRPDYESIVGRMRLGDGTLWPIPITLDVTEEFARLLKPGQPVALRNPEGVMLAVLYAEEIWAPDRVAEAYAVYGTTSTEHPGVAYLLQRTRPFYIGGRVEGVQIPIHYDFREIRLAPSALREEFTRTGWNRVVAFQTRNPMHRAHLELTFRAAKKAGAKLLIHPVVGMTKPGDIEHYTRVRCYKALLSRYPQNTARLSLLPLAMRMAGPREAVWHAIIRKNYGCTHFIVGRDHAGPGTKATGQPFYGTYDAQTLLGKYQEELGLTMVPFRNLVYVEEKDTFFPEDEIPQGTRIRKLSGTDLRQRLAEGRDLPHWFTFPEIARELQRSFPPRCRQGFTVFFTGLSGAGKSTIANVLRIKFLEAGGRPVTLLDGDIVRKHLSSELGFSKKYRDINIRRIGFVASEITKNGGVAMCAPIAPYDSVRREVRAMVEPYGGFVLVYVDTPLEVCEGRDRKGLYAKARAGLIRNFTGVSDPYEPPEDASVVIDTAKLSPEEAAHRIYLFLECQDYVCAGSWDLNNLQSCQGETSEHNAEEHACQNLLPQASMAIP